MAQVHSNRPNGLPTGLDRTPYVITVPKTAHSVSAQMGRTSDNDWATAPSPDTAVIRHLDGGPGRQPPERSPPTICQDSVLQRPSSCAGRLLDRWLAQRRGHCNRTDICSEELAFVQMMVNSSVSGGVEIFLPPGTR
jgi:hypothetical protein